MIKGYKHTNEAKAKMRFANLGKHFSPKTEFTKGQRYSISTEFKKGLVPWNKGKKGLQVGWNKGKKGLVKMSLETRKKMSLTRKGRISYWLGKKHTYEYRKKMSEATKGEKGNNWQGGITPINEAIRKSFEYEEWRKLCMDRDLYTCQNCEQIGGKLHVDHIKPFALFPELRFEVSNGRTLCEECHWLIGAKVKHFSTRADFEEEANLIGMLVSE